MRREQHMVIRAEAIAALERVRAYQARKQWKAAS